MIYNELEQRGTNDFPLAFYHLDKAHPRYEMAHHWHSEIELIRVLSGTLVVRLNDKEYRAQAGDILFVNPETVHSAMPQDCVYECIVCFLDLLCKADGSCKSFIDSLLNHEYKIKEYHPAAHSAFHTAGHSLFDALQRKSAGYKFLVLGAIYALLGAVVETQMYTSIDGKTVDAEQTVIKLKKVLSFMRENYEKPITLSDMAQAAGMSAKYFCYFFRSKTSKTPVEYLNTYRVECATRQLINSDKSVTEIAYACGFNDLSYFIKTFKSHKGITPAKFRRG